MRRLPWLAGLAVAGLFIGCGADKKASSPHAGSRSPEREVALEPNAGIGGVPAAGGAKAVPPVPAADRKIIYEGTVALVVPDVDPAAERVRAAATRFDAYISASDVTGSAGYRRTATFTLRVPADKFEPLREALTQLGEVTRNSSKSEDVTEEFHDLDARLKVLKQEEESLKELLKKEAGKLDDLLKVRDHLTHNRIQIERAEGRQRFLSAKVTYSTLTVELSETKDYVPPSSPTFGGRVQQLFWQSVEGLENAGKMAVLFVVAVAPWLPLILPAAWLLRRAARKARR